MSERYEQLAEAFLLVAKADHYMVGIVVAFTDDELDAAEQVLISRDNAEPDNPDVNLALDCIEQERQSRLRRDSRNVGRTKGDDDGQEYGDPRDYRDGKE